MKTHFFLPQRKEEGESQIIFNEEEAPPETSVEDILIQNSIHSMFMQTLTYSSDFVKSLINGYRSHLVLNESTYKDERFDSLTLPDFPSDEFSPAIRYELYPEQFILLTKIGEIAKFPYSEQFFPLLESLETGIVSPLLYGFLDQQGFKEWDSGKVLARVTDFRYEPEREEIRLLSMTNQIYDMFINNEPSTNGLTDRQKLEIEQKVLLLRHSTLCTDPSPDVGRAYSIMDNKRKMWAIYRERNEKEFKPSKKPPAPPKEIKLFKRTKADGRIVPPKIPILTPNPPDDNK